MNGNRFVILRPVAVLFTGMKTDPPAHSGKRVLFEKGVKRFLVSAFGGQVKKLGNRVSCGASLLAGSRHERGLRLLETPLACFDEGCASIRNGNNKFG
jgi:hypothetical protein